MPSGLIEKCLSYFRRKGAPPLEPYCVQLAQVRARQSELSRITDDGLQRIAGLVRERPELIEAFALAAEAARRTIALQPFDVQILGALAMAEGNVVEMQTGEGKTLTAVMTAYFKALSGGGVHVLTANDYLASRDSHWMGEVYRFLGVSNGFVSQSMDFVERRSAYACDIVYATPNEVGFDYLRDGLARSPDEMVHRPFSFALVDEVDSILIDEARIPLVIAGGDAAPQDLALRLARIASELRRHADYFFDDHARNVQLTDMGAARVESALHCQNLYDPGNLHVLTAVLDAVHAHALLKRDVDYVVRDGKVELVDEIKGRIAQNRRWPAGLQTALEAKEGVPLCRQGRVLGSITLQNLIALYPGVCGMTGTAATQAAEFKQFYELETVVIPTNRPVIREDQPDVVFPTRAAKERALLEEIAEVHATGRPVLVGTSSVAESEALSAKLTSRSVRHQVLNARNDEAEARIIAQAGALGAVTISTNMAGRGTDIVLGGSPPQDRERVLELGGLYVIGTNRHESRRIDNQLRGRAGRQGDPGSSRFFISLEDDLLVRFGIREMLAGTGFRVDRGAISDPQVTRGFESVQRMIEQENLEIRRTLWKYEKAVEDQRLMFRDRRMDIFEGIAPSLLELHDPERYANLVRRLGQEAFDALERGVRLSAMDDAWAEHLAAVADLRSGIHWLAWGGREPLHAFWNEAIRLFDEMTERIDEEVLTALAAEQAVSSALAESARRGATWTYLVNDNPFGSMTDRLAQGLRRRLRERRLLG